MISDTLAELLEVLGDDPDPRPHLTRAFVVALADEDVAAGDAAAAVAVACLVSAHVGTPGLPDEVYAWWATRQVPDVDDLVPHMLEVFDLLLHGAAGWAEVRASTEVRTLDHVREVRRRFPPDAHPLPEPG